MSGLSNIKKAFGMPTADSVHQYAFKSGEYGNYYQYWWRDQAGNYYRYSNAPEDHPDFDPFWGVPLMDPDQPLPEKNPEFFSPEGFLLHMAIPEGTELQRNPNYNQFDPRNIWFGAVPSEYGPIYIYLDADIKENLDLYVQNQLRVVDSGLPRLRKKATELFAQNDVRDKLTGMILILCDQGFFEPEELVNASVGDVSFVDQAVILLGRKMVCDLKFFDVLTSLVAGRAPTEPLFQFETKHGTKPVGLTYMNSVFFGLRVSPKFLLNWNASHMYSRIVNRLLFEKVPVDEVDVRATSEVGRALSTREDVRYLIDYKVRTTLIRNYEASIAGEASPITKSLGLMAADDFGIAVIRSDLTGLRPDEKEFSDWLHATPMHDTSPAQEAAVAEAIGSVSEEEKQQDTNNSASPPASPEDLDDTQQAIPDEEVPE